MSEVKLHFRKPGLQTLVQDEGRQGHQAFGVPVSGPLDRASAKAANRLVGNTAGSTLLEITLIGPEIEISGSCYFAITGANMSPKLDGLEVKMNEAIHLTNKGTLSFEKAKYGCRAYMAIGGEWHIKSWLGSKSAATHNGTELTPDSIIAKDSIINITSYSEPPASVVVNQPVFSNVVRVRVMPGPEFDLFSREAIADFFGSGHTLNTDSNRMGYRLNPAIRGFKPEKEIISSGIVSGTVQVTNSGQPIVLLADAQTTGGYHRIANVIDEDLDKLGQLKPGDEIWFSLAK